MTETVAYLQAEAEANWIRTEQPDIWEQTHKYLFLSGYLTYKLTGRFVDSAGCQVGLCAVRLQATDAERGLRLEMAGRADGSAVLPDLVPPGAPLGEITPQATAATGIPVGLPLIARPRTRRAR